jgi:hypothetical protein
MGSDNLEYVWKKTREQLEEREVKGIQKFEARNSMI